MTTVIAIIAAIFLFFISVTIIIYNGLVRKRSMTEEAWSGIDVQLRRRHNLIPALIETVKTYASHEKKVFEDIAKSRERCLGAKGNVEELAKAENSLLSGLKSVFAIAENYPDLKANTNFIEFQNELSEIEEQVQMARRYYNGSTRELNIAVESFPSNIIAGMFSFSKREYFEIEEAQKVMPKVSFS
jgi:LemA protein